MNITFVPEMAADTVIEEIVIDGQTCGEMKVRVAPGPYQSPFHASLYAGERSMNTLIQGFGAKREEAVLDALRSGRENAERVLVEIAALEKRLLG